MQIHTIPFGKPEAFTVLVEIPEGSRNKYEYDGSIDAIKLDFVFSGDLAWPFNYGFICGTRGGDGDMLDACVLSSAPIHPGILVQCRAVGMMETIDRGEEDHKILCVPIVDALMERYQDLEDFSEEQLRSYEDFYRELAVQKNKILELKGFHNRLRTEQEILKSIID